ncbi:MAG: DUF3095 domain-containing protein [Saprospiraceae bacterium]
MLASPAVFQQIPGDWQVVVTDIKNSTATVKSGGSEIINLAATGSIIAALNIATPLKIDLPFFFGGDGATLLVPPDVLTEIMTALKQHQSNIKTEFNLDLRVGSLAVSEVYANACVLKIARARITPLFSIPIVLGTGLQYAEKVIKARHINFDESVQPTGQLNLEGMECRWSRIAPPENTDEVVCLLISAVEESAQADIFKKILDEAEQIYGSHKKRNPISLPRLRLDLSLQKLRQEVKMRAPKLNSVILIKDWIISLIGHLWYLPSTSGQRYLNELVQLSDIFVLDGRINMIISGTSTQRKQLTAFLDALEKQGAIIYGIHVSKESIMSCYVRNRNAQHIHFVDGSEGGYTKAAVLLKAKLRKRG